MKHTHKNEHVTISVLLKEKSVSETCYIHTLRTYTQISRSGVKSISLLCRVQESFVISLWNTLYFSSVVMWNKPLNAYESRLANKTWVVSYINNNYNMQLCSLTIIIHMNWLTFMWSVFFSLSLTVCFIFRSLCYMLTPKQGRGQKAECLQLCWSAVKWYSSKCVIPSIKVHFAPS